MDELNMLRKKVLDLEKDNRLSKETEKKLHATNQQLLVSGQQLKSKQETLIRTQRIARVGSWEWDVATDTVTWSDELFHIFKLNPENGAVSYADHPKIYAPGSMQRLDAAVQHTLKTGEPYEIDLEILRTDGTNAFCTARGYAEKDEKGKVVRLLGSLQDITERKNAEEELKKSEERLRTVIDNSPFPIAVVDRKDNHIQYWSKSAIQLFGHNPKTSEEWYELVYPNPEYRQNVIERWKPFLEIARNSKKTINTGEYEIVCKNGTIKICEIYAQFIPGSLIVTLNDITERKNTEEHLKKIEWLLQNKKEKTEIKIPDYGDLTTINQNRTILDSVGKEVLNGIVSDYLTLLETSAAVYEKNGDYAVGIFSSEWCWFMDCSSRKLCKTKNNKTALESGKWLCHESCWADASNQSIQTNKPVDIECSGGLNIYAIPISANNEVIGSINFGYGNPPTNEDKLIEIAANYNVSVDKLKDLAQSYETRPAFIIDIAKEKLETSSKLIGNIVERKRLEDDHLRNQKRYEKAQALGHVGNWEYDPVSSNFWASDEAKRIYGYGLNLDDFSTEMVESCILERERVHQALLDLLEHNKKYDLVFDILTHDKGIRKTIHSIAELERDAPGNPLKITGVIYDITKQKKAEDKLKALNQHLIASEQQLRAANQQLKANEQQLEAANQQLSASEQQLLASNQQLEANEQQLRAANQALLEAKENAEESEERFKLAMNASNDGLFDWNLKTNEIYYSPGWKKMLGYEDHEIPNDFSIWEKTTAPEDVKKSWEMQHKLITKQIDRFEIEFKMKHKDGHWVDILSRAEAIFDDEGKAVRMIGTHIDISLRKKVELDLIVAKEKAQESEEKYKALYENAPLSYQSLNEDGSFNDVNPTWLSTLGYKREEVIGKFYKDFLHPSWQSNFEKNFPVFKKRGYVSNVQFKIRHKKGHYIDISFEGCIGYHPDGSFKQTYCVFQDITEKNRALEELVIAKEKAEESKKRFKCLIENAPDAVVINDKEGRLIYASSNAFRHFGYSENEIIGHFGYEFTHPEDLNIVYKAFDTIVRNPDQKATVKYRFKKRNGEYRWIETTFTNLLDDETIAGFVLNFSDITEKNRALEELVVAKEKAEEEEEKYRRLYESNLMPISIFDAETLEFLSVNNAFVEKYGYTKEEFLKMTILDIRPESEFEILKQSVSIEDNGLENRGVFHHKKKNGEIIQVEIIRYDLVYEGKNAKLVFANDISKLKRSEIELIKAKEKAEEADRLKSAFLANMSHEIRTPMNGILGFTSLLLEPNLTGEEQLKFIEIIQKSGQRMLSTVNDIIDISRIETGQVELSISDVNVCAEIETLFQFFKAEANKKGLELKLNKLYPDIEKYFKTDRHKFNSILTNLIKNAIKFTDKGSIEITCEKKNHHFVCSVKDTGIGIPENRKKAVFDRFVQADIGDTRAFEGSGLGLSIIKAYVEMLDGRIYLKSEVGVGTTFFFELPDNSSAKEIKEIHVDDASVKTKNPLEKLKILIAEDDEVSFLHLSIILKDAVSEIIHAKTGAEAVDLCKKNKDVNLILMDLKMPVMDGFEATRKIREFNKKIIIVAQTAFALSGDREKAIGAGCNDYVSKPINKDKLINKVAKWIN